MPSIRYIIGDALRPTGDGAKVIVHVCNDLGVWGKGFVMAVSKRWKEPEAEYRRWHIAAAEPPFGLGQVQFVKVEERLWVANLIGQHGIRKAGGKPPIRYDAVEGGLRRVAEFAMRENASVHMPRIGCGLAGGRWEEIEPIIERTLLGAGIPVAVYDLPT